MKETLRATATLLVTAALWLSWPIAALADPGVVDANVDADVSDSDVDAAATLSVETTGTSAPLTAPTLDASTSDAGLAASQTTATTSLTNSSSSATVGVGHVEHLAQGASAQLSANDPFTRTELTAAARANAVICLLAQLRVDPSRALLSSLCEGDASTADATLGASLANGITGTRADAATAARAAVCLLARASSPAPRTIDLDELASASLSTLCGTAPSTVDAGGDAQLNDGLTDADIAAAPVASLAACLLANATAGEPTVLELATACGPEGAATPSGGNADVPATARAADSSVDSDVVLEAALCILARAEAGLDEATLAVTDACAAAPGEGGMGGNGGGGGDGDRAVTPPSGGNGAPGQTGPTGPSGGTGQTGQEGSEGGPTPFGLGGLPSTATGGLALLGLLLVGAGATFALSRRRGA